MLLDRTMRPLTHSVPDVVVVVGGGGGGGGGGVLTLTRIIKSAVTGQAPFTLEWRNTPEKYTPKPKVVHACIIADASHESAKRLIQIRVIVPHTACKVSSDKIFDLTSGVCFNFHTVLWKLKLVHLHTGGQFHGPPTTEKYTNNAHNNGGI